MGRIKTKLIKRTAKQLISEYRGEFKKSFEDNKLLVSKFTDVPSKKMRNVIAGYVTRLVKQKE